MKKTKKKFFFLMRNLNLKYYIFIFSIITILEYIFYQYNLYNSFNICLILLAWFNFIYWYYELSEFESNEREQYKKNEKGGPFFLFPVRILIRFFYIKYKLIKYLIIINKDNKFYLFKLTIIVLISLILYRHSRTIFLLDIIEAFDLGLKFISMLPIIGCLLQELAKSFIQLESPDLLSLTGCKNLEKPTENILKQMLNHPTKDWSSIKRKYSAVLPKSSVSEPVTIPQPTSIESKAETKINNLTKESIKSRFEIVNNIVNLLPRCESVMSGFNLWPNSESEYMLYDASKKAVRKLTHAELEETTILYGNIRIKKYILIHETCEAYLIKNMGSFIHTPMGLKQNTFLDLYWLEQYVREPDIKKRYNLYINNFFDFAQHFKSITQTYNGGKSLSAQNAKFLKLAYQNPDAVGKSVEISNAFFKQFAEDIRELHNDGYFQLIGRNEILQINHFFYELEIIPYINVDKNVALHFHAIKASKIYGEIDAALIFELFCLSLQSKVATSWAVKDQILNTWFTKTKYAYTDMLFFHFRHIFISVRNFNPEGKLEGYTNYLFEPNTNKGEVTSPSLSPDQQKIDQELINKKTSDQYNKQRQLEEKVGGKNKNLPADYFADDAVITKQELELTSKKIYRSIDQFNNKLKDDANRITDN